VLAWCVLTCRGCQAKIIYYYDVTVKKTRERLELTTEQAKIIDPLVAKYERLEHEYVEDFMDDLMKIQEFIKQGRDDEDECVLDSSFA